MENNKDKKKLPRLGLIGWFRARLLERHLRRKFDREDPEWREHMKTYVGEALAKMNKK